MDKDTWVKLAKGFVKDQQFFGELEDAMRKIRTRAKTGLDYCNLPYEAEILVNTVSDVLGEDFSYWYYDCNKSFDKFNKRVTFLTDGSHPNVNSLEELYDFIKEDL